MTSVAYRTVSPQFHDLIWIDVVSDGQGTARMALSIYGRFITNPLITVNARDIAKSFIQDGLATSEDRAKIMPIARDIYYRWVPGTEQGDRGSRNTDEYLGMLKQQIDLGKGITVFAGNDDDAPEMPEVYSRGYAVFIGERASFAAGLSRTQFSMRNEAADGERLLTIAFDRRT